ncbi:MAG: rhodanese-like domain-containing protein [Paramuribaculum sp.]|nr:rhodanese-like domain-containing protein [Paramuribaculum sp.]
MENNTSTTATFTTVAPAEFSKIIKEDNVYLIDVRHPDEWAEGHIAGAANLDVMAEGFVDEAKRQLPEEDTIAVYCGTGKRSGMASEELAAAGFKIVNLEGGLNAWEAAGLPIEK